MVASISYIERIIDTYEKATEAALKTPGRQNGIICLTAELADEVMVTGDLHGHRGNFNTIRRIANLANCPRRHLVLQEVCHGGPTYPENGGCMSHTMLEDVAKLKTQFPGQVHFLLGNHELAELTEYPIQKNKQMLNLMFRLGLQQMYGPATERVRDSYLPFLESCPLAVRLPGGVFISHSIPEEADKGDFDKTVFTREISSLEYYERSSIFSLVWGRDYRPENAKAFAELVNARIVINGHEPCAEGFSVPNDTQIILDCCNDKGCYVMLPVREELSQAEIVERIQKLQ
ncbi:MAG: metallophosphoesterase [Pirellulales bacterium]|nr:metallophosphoesterase [Pirellulales bacterium]